jgi:ABC-type methionine transport system ATPase subunit
MNWSLELDDAVLHVPGAAGLPPASFRVPDGGVHVVASPPNAAAVLVRACLGFEPPRSGRIRVCGTEPYLLPRAALQEFRRRVCAWLLPPALLSNATLHLNVMLPMLHDPRIAPADARERATAMLERCGIAEWSGARPSDVPPAVRTRAALARALAPRPELLLTEDFVARVGHAEMEWVLDLCRERAQAVVIATTAAERISQFADSVHVLPHGGSLVAR